MASFQYTRVVIPKERKPVNVPTGCYSFGDHLNSPLSPKQLFSLEATYRAKLTYSFPERKVGCEGYLEPYHIYIYTP